MSQSEDKDMLDQLARHWWVLALRGVLAILFGLIAFAWPGITLVALVLLFGAYAFIDGLFALFAAAGAAKRYERWVALLFEGAAGIAAGVITFIWPGMTALVLAYVIAFWAIMTGIFEIATAVRLRQFITNEWLLGLCGALSVLTGALVAARPGAGLVGLVWLVGAYAALFGVLLLALGFRLRSLRSDREYHSRATA
jgi:uncharacterized membrane protein HdeD (DUF308 family)